ncbi:MAG: hypothetical protein UU08_C0018G0006 [Candidatus Uhrbacteria bacterium GW2011_GWE2_40_58]|nr:MAG: hypothetical protein UT94_C0044G0006 [Candidatus Uhrbacteria bacterium GW2011_GWF2_40_263]KKR67397.1 MAG: hypothetical protein UU08_C0018G0006 [Candidatus Uhrbacteria bacterium GW2011_GWE2_40_58]OGL94377.1 MAG: hypothetical protein A2239_00345 [Candidatus Uhrbacteria bacterium RIFOXYA2_FULL_40_9]OGL98143.1 MAG: hypothetical protein A2332_02920 [Candidatus Uhrbacteria bacterium RIFOXYB2_FULL_41_18]HBK35153.1 hypothetical protein [Candidatus Uhrbacteria bacterium]
MIQHNPEFLSQKYADLPGSKPVERAVAKKLRKGEKAHSKEERIEAYLERLEGITEDERGYRLLKHLTLKNLTLDTSDTSLLEKIARDLYQSEKRIAEERGQGGHLEQLGSTKEIIENYKPLIKEKAEIQRRTLSSWLNGLEEHADENPMWFRYLIVRSLGQMGTLDKEKGRYSRRSSKTISPFPEFNFEAIGLTRRWLTEGIDPKDELEDERTETIQKAIDKKDFATLYAIAQIETAGRLNRETTRGQWRKYDQGSDYRILESELKGKGTGWCTAEGSAKDHLEHGDFYVYYTYATAHPEEDEQATEPRVAIRMQEGHVAEVRGVNTRQELEPELNDIAKGKYHDLPGGEKFDKKSEDMDRLNVIYYKTFRIDKKTEEKTFLHPTLTTEELLFLYEIDSSIESFGYDKHPRIKEILDTRNKEADFEALLPMLVTIREKTGRGDVCTTLELQYLYEVKQKIRLGSFDRSHVTDIIAQRNPEADMPVVFECEPSQIASIPYQINENTKAYVGKLDTGIFQMFLKYNIEYIYTSFPEGRRIERRSVEVGGKTREELLRELQAKGVDISDQAKVMMEHENFEKSLRIEDKNEKDWTKWKLKPAQDMDFIRLSVADLNIQGTTKTDSVYARAQKLGLELVPPDAVPAYRLATLDQAMDDLVYMGMEQIADADGNPSVFYVERYVYGSWLDYDWAYPDRRWSSSSEFVFRLRKSETDKQV